MISAMVHEIDPETTSMYESGGREPQHGRMRHGITSKFHSYGQQLGWHALFLAAGQLLASFPITEDSWHDDTWSEWLGRSLLTRGDSLWLSDGTDRTPLDTREILLALSKGRRVSPSRGIRTSSFLWLASRAPNSARSLSSRADGFPRITYVSKYPLPSSRRPKAQGSPAGSCGTSRWSHGYRCSMRQRMTTSTDVAPRRTTRLGLFARLESCASTQMTRTACRSRTTDPGLRGSMPRYASSPVMIRFTDCGITIVERCAFAQKHGAAMKGNARKVLPRGCDCTVGLRS